MQQFNGSSQTVGTPAIANSLSEDVYLSIVDLPTQGPISVIVVIMPLAVWLWTGGAVMAVGTALSIIPNRKPRRPLRVPEPDALAVSDRPEEFAVVNQP